MQKLVRILLVGALIALGVWGWRTLFPNPERIIRAQLNSLAEIVSFEPGEGNISRVYNIGKLIEFFTLDVEIYVQPHGYSAQTLNGRDEVMQAVTYVRSTWPGLTVEFQDINVALGEDKETAVANLTATITQKGDREFIVQELNFLFRKIEKRWVIYRVETVKTLS